MAEGYRPQFRQTARIREIGRYLETHPGEPVTLPQLSRRFGVPLTTMKRCFEAVYGMPVSRYLRRVRIRRAAALLRSTDDTILSVAGQVGYSNGSKFAAAFKAEMGVNPSEYRRTEEPEPADYQKAGD